MTLLLAVSQAAAASEDPGDKATARQLFQDAGAAMERSDFETAADLYGRSNTLFPAPTAALGEARALVKLDRLLDAYERYNALVTANLGADAPEAFKQAVIAADKERGLVFERLPALVVKVEGQGAVSLDGRPLPTAALGVKRLVNPGTHRITAPGVARVVSVREGQVLEVPIQIPAGAEPPKPAPPPVEDDGDPGSAQRVTGYVMLGLGGAGVVASAVTGGLYLSARGTVDDECDEQALCSQAGLDAADRARTLGTVNLITFFGGIAAAGVGLTLVLTADEGHQLSIAPTALPRSGGITITGRW
jgi:hypothetical protein